MISNLMFVLVPTYDHNNVRWVGLLLNIEKTKNRRFESAVFFCFKPNKRMTSPLLHIPSHTNKWLGSSTLSFSTLCVVFIFFYLGVVICVLFQ